MERSEVYRTPFFTHRERDTSRNPRESFLVPVSHKETPDDVARRGGRIDRQDPGIGTRAFHDLNRAANTIEGKYSHLHVKLNKRTFLIGCVTGIVIAGGSYIASYFFEFSHYMYMADALSIGIPLLAIYSLRKWFRRRILKSQDDAYVRRGSKILDEAEQDMNTKR